jgi:hypothetical protein
MLSHLSLKMTPETPFPSKLKPPHEDKHPSTNAACAMAAAKLPRTPADPSIDQLLSSLQANETNDDMVRPTNMRTEHHTVS